MKQAKTILFSLLIPALALALSACAKPTVPAEPDKTAEIPEVPAVIEPVEPESQTAETPALCDRKPAFTVEFAADDRITEDVKVLTDSDSEFVNNILFTAKRDVTDVRYLEVSAELTEAGEVRVTEGETLYTFDGLKTGEQFLIPMALEGYLPNRLITYSDACGGTHRYYVMLSGKDNRPLFVELPEPNEQ